MINHDHVNWYWGDYWLLITEYWLLITYIAFLNNHQQLKQGPMIFKEIDRVVIAKCTNIMYTHVCMYASSNKLPVFISIRVRFIRTHNQEKRNQGRGGTTDDSSPECLRKQFTSRNPWYTQNKVMDDASHAQGWVLGFISFLIIWLIEWVINTYICSTDCRMANCMHCWDEVMYSQCTLLSQGFVHTMYRLTSMQ